MDARLATTDDPTKQALAGAYRQRVAKFAWQVGGIGATLVAIALAALGVGASVLFDFGAFGNTTIFAMLVVPIIVAVTAFVAGNKANQRSGKLLQEAWRLGANRVFANSGGRISAEVLSRGMGINLDEATELLAEAEVSQFLGSAQFQNAPGAAAHGRLRIDAAPTESPEQAAERELRETLGNAPTEQFASVKRYDD